MKRRIVCAVGEHSQPLRDPLRICDTPWLLSPYTEGLLALDSCEVCGLFGFSRDVLFCGLKKQEVLPLEGVPIHAVYTFPTLGACTKCVDALFV